MGRRIWIAILAACAAVGQDQARKANDYPAHAEWPQFKIGAEYMVHSIPTEKGALFARDYLVVDVVIFPEKRPISITSSSFSLRVNGKRVPLPAEPSGFVAASLKYTDWEGRTTTTVTAGVGNATVILGQPPNRGRFPDDPTQDRRRTEPRRPEDPTAGTPLKEKDIDTLVRLATLPESETLESVKGCLYFRFDGKTTSIRTLDLEYPDGSSLRILGR